MKKFKTAFVALGVTLALASCEGSRYSADSEVSKNKAKVAVKEIDNRIDRICDTETGNLIYVYRGFGMTVVPGGCRNES